jgi:alpha-tubulin suppressor-like RCC1 family protein
MRSVAAGDHHSLALSSDSRVYSWGKNKDGQLGHGDELDRVLPVLVDGLESVRNIAAAGAHSLAVTQSGDVYGWGCTFQSGAKEQLRPIVVEGFGGLRVRSVCAAVGTAFAIGEAGQLVSWGGGWFERLGHADTEDQPLPKRVEALRDVRVSSVLVGIYHALALAEDRLVYAWGYNMGRTVLGNPYVEGAGGELLKPVEALRGVLVGSIAAAGQRSYAVADTGEVWAWGGEGGRYAPLGHGDKEDCPIPKLVEALRGIRVDAVVAGINQRWRGEMMEACTRGAMRRLRRMACLPWELQSAVWPCPRHSSSRRCMWLAKCDGIQVLDSRRCVEK